MKHNINHFLERSRKVHGDKYDYSRVNYINRSTKVEIICPKHGVFEQMPSNHYSGQNCPTCARENRGKSNIKTASKNFTKKAKKIHEDKYNYDKVNYTGVKNKVRIICPTHGEFEQTPNDHLAGYGCPKCGYEKVSKKLKTSRNDFILEANKVYGNKYDYSKFDYVNTHTKSIIICPEHGEFLKDPVKHLYRNQGCPVCSKNRKESFGEEYINKYLADRDYKFNREYIFNDNEWISNKPFDFYLPDHNLIIEFHGEQHFRKKFKMTDSDLEIRKEIDMGKRNFLLSKEVNFLVIKYNEDIEKKLNEYFSSTTIEREGLSKDKQTE